MRAIWIQTLGQPRNGYELDVTRISSRPSPRERSNCGFGVSEMAFFSSADPYNPTTTATPIICHFGKISNFISPALERCYGGEGECAKVSMTNSRQK
jgi:hypothetical protein